MPLDESTPAYLYETADIGVKLLSEAELTIYPTWFNDVEVCAHNQHLAFGQTVEECRAYIQQQRQQKSALVWAAFLKNESLKQEHQHIGNISLQAIHWINNSAELAFLFGAKEHWGKGYAFQAAQLLMAHGFNRLNLHRIYCATAATNERMLRLAQKLGFIQEGLRKEALFLNGHYCDSVEFGITQHDWQSAQQPD
jgi:RimJ/RimL family protein N-acetyltransferase